MKCEELWNVFEKFDLTYFTGVPDSTFKQWMSFLDDVQGEELVNRVSSIERDAIGWASGYHSATGKIGVVYMQNSGLGNIVNPITSLVDVYKIPMLFMVGWRGEPGKNDEPQHIMMGQIMIPILDTLGIKHSILPDDTEEAEKIIFSANEYMKQENKPYALVIKKGIFENYEKKKKTEQIYELGREEAIKILVDNMCGDEIISSTTGKASRELFEYRKEKDFGHQNDFLMVGSMGLASSFGAEIALQKPDKKVFVFDGDGALIMSMGSLSTIGHYAPKNLYHVVFDNECHESTGGQSTTSHATDFEKLALANNYKRAKTIKTKEELEIAIKDMINKEGIDKEGPQMLIIKVKKGSRKDLGRPTTTPRENKEAFMKFLSNKY